MKFRILVAAMLVAGMGGTPPQRAADGTSLPSRDITFDTAPLPADPIPPAPGVQLDIRTANDAAPGDFLWTARPVVVFATSPEDPAFIEQMRVLNARPQDLIERDVVVITDTDPRGDSDWRDALHPGMGFSLVIMDKDGQVKLRKPLPWDAREISRAIDKFPLRRQEIGRMGVAP